MEPFEPWSMLSAPSTSHMLEDVAPPLTEMPTPPRSPLFTVLRPSEAVTPGWSSVSCRKLRPLSGSSRTWSPLVRPATSAPTDFTERAAASTLTSSASSPVESRTSTSRTSATLMTIFVLTAGLNRGNVTWTWYLPTGRSGNE